MASRWASCIVILLLLGVSLAAADAVIQGIAESGDRVPASPQPDTTTPAWVETLRFDVDVIANAGVLGRCAYVERVTGAEAPPADLGGLLIEARARGVVDDPNIRSMGMLVLADRAVVARSTDADERGVLRVSVSPERWPVGELAVVICPPGDEALPTVLALSRVTVYLSFAHGGPLPEGFSALP